MGERREVGGQAGVGGPHGGAMVDALCVREEVPWRSVITVPSVTRTVEWRVIGEGRDNPAWGVTMEPAAGTEAGSTEGTGGSEGAGRAAVLVKAKVGRGARRLRQREAQAHEKHGRLAILQAQPGVFLRACVLKHVEAREQSQQRCLERWVRSGGAREGAPPAGEGAPSWC